MNRSLMFFAMILIAACSGKQERTTEASQVDSVFVFELQKLAVERTIRLPAELHPLERAELYAKVEGYVKDIAVDIGSRVKRGDVLMNIDAPEVTANYARASADLQAAQSRYLTSRDIFQRTSRAAREKGAVSDSEMEKTRNQMLADSAGYEAARSATRAYAQLNSYLVIRAAFDGVITRRNVDPGTLVGNSNELMLVLENQRSLRLRVAVPEVYASTILPSTTLAFTIDAEPSKTFEATFARRSNEIDPRTRTERWEFEVMNRSGVLKSGMLGNVQLSLRRQEPSFVIPGSALVTTLERSFIIRVRDGKTEWVDVQTGLSMKDQAEVFGDLHAGDLVVARASDELKPGTKVVVKR